MKLRLDGYKFIPKFMAIQELFRDYDFTLLQGVAAGIFLTGKVIGKADISFKKEGYRYAFYRHYYF